jgi:hemoglobin
VRADARGAGSGRCPPRRPLGGPELYAGRDLGAVHSPLGITDGQFDAVAGHLADTLAELGLPDELNRTVIARVASLRPLIVAKPLAVAS